MLSALGRTLLLFAVAAALGLTVGLAAERFGFTPVQALCVSAPASLGMAVWYRRRPPGVR